MSRSGPQVEVPKDDGVRLGRVGAIAAACFAVGLVWPRLAGFSLVPEVPGEGRSGASEAAQAEPSEPPVAAAPAEDQAQAEPAAVERLHVGEAQITSCRDGGKVIKPCDAPSFDDAVLARLKSLIDCPGAEAAYGKLSLGFDWSAGDGKVQGVSSGRSTTLPSELTEQLLGCARERLAAAPVKAKAEHEEYTVYYLLEFEAAGPGARTTPTDVVEASGSATVRWKTALIRREPETGADVRARLLSGTRVLVTARKGDWYRVKYDAKGREGWVHGEALGLETDKE